jgi:hypothetical protein
MSIKPLPIEYKYNETTGDIILPKEAPFDGKPCLIKLAEGLVEAWWEDGKEIHTYEGIEYEGFQWICLDDKFQEELDNASYWMPLPTFEDFGDEEVA